MKIGVPKEIKADEYRVGLVPSSVRELTTLGHEVFIESQAGLGIGISDTNYIDAGATIIPTAAEVFAVSTLIVKVKEPQVIELDYLKPAHILFTFLHLGADLKQAQGLLESGCSALAYETVTDAFQRLPLLTPMSMVAGRLAVQAGAHALEKAQLGRGILLGAIPGIAPAQVLIIGGGVVGTQAIRMAIGMEAQVTVMDQSLACLENLEAKFGGRLNTVFFTQAALEYYLATADLVIGAVLIPGSAAPKLLTRSMLSLMQPGSVLVDVAIDQGGCFETSRATTHSSPMYIEEQIVHYCVANMPGAVPRTATLALNNATLPFIILLAELGLCKSCEQNSYLQNGLNIYQGKVTHPAVAAALDHRYYAPQEVLINLTF
jgi:alanine dehydrogenase